MKNIVMVIILIMIGSYSVQAQNTASTKIEGTEAEKVLVNGEMIFKKYKEGYFLFEAMLKYKKKLYFCTVYTGSTKALEPYCVTVLN